MCLTARAMFCDAGTTPVLWHKTPVLAQAMEQWGLKWSSDSRREWLRQANVKEDEDV